MTVVQDYIKDLIQCLEDLPQQNLEHIANIIVEAWRKGKCVFIMGNGGSATTATHFARDLKIGIAVTGKPRVRAVSLTDSVAVITALANDTSYSSIFKEQLVGQLEEGDVAIGISASGNSTNVIKAIEYARKSGATTIGLIGFEGGKLKKLVDSSVTLSNKDYGQVEDVHLCLAHIISYLVKEGINDDQ